MNEVREVCLQKMTAVEYDAFRVRCLCDYPDDVAKASGASPELATEFGKKQFEEMLPAGMETPNYFFFRILEAGVPVGDLWYQLKDTFELKRVFVCDIYINQDCRGRGLGKVVMKLLESQAVELGATQIILHVFAHNPQARRLYQALGFYETNINMRKDLG